MSRNASTNSSEETALFSKFRCIKILRLTRINLFAKGMNVSDWSFHFDMKAAYKYNESVSENFRRFANKSFKGILPQWTAGDGSSLRSSPVDGILGYNFREAHPELFAWYTSKPWPSSACRYRYYNGEK